MYYKCQGQPVVIPYFACDVKYPIISLSRLIDRGYDLYWANTGTILRRPHLYELHLKEMETVSTYQQNHKHLRKDGKQSLHLKDMYNSKKYSNDASTKSSLHQHPQQRQEQDPAWEETLFGLSEAITSSGYTKDCDEKNLHQKIHSVQYLQNNLMNGNRLQ